MPKEAVFTLKLEAELRDQFLAAAEASHRPASQLVRELMRDYIDRQTETRAYDAFVAHKIAFARASIEAGDPGLSNEDIEDEFAPWRAEILGPEQAA